MELLILIVASMGGGVFAAIIGATNSFIFTGIVGLIGVGVQMATGNNLYLDYLSSGSFLGPHVAFNAGVVALALTKRLYSDSVAKNLDGKDAFMPLYKYKKSLPILAAAFTGAGGLLLNLFMLQKLKLKIDTIALTIVITNLATRLLIGKTGLIPKATIRGNRYHETNKNLIFNLIWGLGFSAIVAYITIITNNPFFGFYFSAASLMFMAMGKDIPFSHHISLVTGYAVTQSGSIWIGILFGFVSIPIFEYLQASLNPEADTLIEVSTLTITIMSVIIFNFL